MGLEVLSRFREWDAQGTGKCFHTVSPAQFSSCIQYSRKSHGVQNSLILSLALCQNKPICFICTPQPNYVVIQRTPTCQNLAGYSNRLELILIQSSILSFQVRTLPLYKVRAHQHVSQKIVKMVISLDRWFFLHLHNVTLLGMDSAPKCHIMQKYQKSHLSKDMIILTFFCDTCWWALLFTEIWHSVLKKTVEKLSLFGIGSFLRVSKDDLVEHWS